MTTWKLYARDPSGLRQGQIEGWSDAELIPKFNDVGTWRVTVPADYAALFEEQWGVEWVRDGEVVLSGIYTSKERIRDATRDNLDLAGVDDNIWLAWRLMSPQPATSAPPYNVQIADVRTGVASTIILQYVDVNAGPSAIAPRQVPGLTMAADPAVGSTVTGRARWFQLLAGLRYLASISTPRLGFRIRSLQFEVYQPDDLSAAVKFSLGLGNLPEYKYNVEAPGATYAIVGGGGEGTARTIVERYDGASLTAWGRIEKFVDRRDTTDSTELQQAGDKLLVDQASRSGVSATPIDAQGRAYLTDYDVGDIVTVVVDGTELADIVQQVKITLDDKGETIVPGVGSTASQFDALRMFSRLADIEERIRNLEVR